MKKCFCYCRQSVGDDDFSESVETQSMKLKEKAASLGLEVVEVFTDLNTSGKTYEEGGEAIAKMDLAFLSWCKTTSRVKKYRKGFGDLVKRLDEVDAVLVWDLTRLFRPVTGSFLESHIMQIFTSHKVKLICLDGGEVDFTSFSDGLITSIQNRINDHQIKLQVEKSQAVLKRLKDAGEWDVPCFRSFGYRSTGRKREIEIDPLKAVIVKKIFEGYLRGLSYYKISKEINPGYYEKRGKTVFKTHLFRILRNPIYCGYYRDSNGELIKAKPIEGKEIIDFDTWKRAQDRLAENRETPKRSSVNWLPISGRVFCGYCGEHIRGCSYGGHYIQYRCMSYEKHGFGRDHSCRNGISWDSPMISEHRGSFLKNALLGMTPIYFMSKLEESKTVNNREVQKLEVELMNIDKKLKTLTESFMDGLLDEGVYKDTLKTTNKKKQELEQQLDKLKSVTDSGRYDTMQLLVDLNELEDREEEDLTEIFKWTFKKLTLFKDHIVIETPKGDLELPIKRLGKAKELPKHEILVGEKPAIVYYYDDFSEDETDWTLMKTIGGVDFYMQR